MNQFDENDYAQIWAYGAQAVMRAIDHSNNMAKDANIFDAYPVHLHMLHTTEDGVDTCRCGATRKLGSDAWTTDLMSDLTASFLRRRESITRLLAKQLIKNQDQPQTRRSE